MKKIVISSLIIFVLLVVLISTLVSMFRFAYHNQPYIYGVSFSKAQAQSLGVDWQEAYRAILGDLGIKKLRLMSYWNQIEPTPGQYDFADLDWQFEEANKHNAKVSLAIGLRQPRWPECHEPAWAKDLNGSDWQQSLDAYMSAVINRYKDNPALESWQLENEFFNKDFGSNCRDYDQERLVHEYQLTKQLDPTHPIILNQSNQFGIPISQPHPDAYGFSIYKRVYDSRFFKRYITHPMSAWYQSLRAMIVENLWHKPVIIHELQAEPWSTRPLSSTSAEEANQTMSPLQLQRNLNFARRTGIHVQYLWGAEWWYYQKTIQGNDAYWEIIRQNLQQ